MKTKLKIEIKFKWYDFWVGWFWDKNSRSLYICLLPMIPIKITSQKLMECPMCGKAMKKTAYLDEGWLLSWDCNECAIAEEIDWPYGNAYMRGSQLEEDGFYVI